MAKVQRHLSIHFNTRFFKGITHEEILSGIEKRVELDNVGSVQFTETDCIISVKDLNTKEKLISGGITLKNRSVNFLDVEKTITNVTIKDAPYEVSDCYIATQMMKYGEVIPGSVRRGYIKGTNIENGSRYLQIINCAPTLPNRTDFGRFEVRLFADNNRTQCLHCKQTNHPSYACRQKPTWQKRCYNCNDLGHLARDCMSAPTCSFCKQEGHIRRDCELYDTDQARRDFGSYAPEIIEGRKTTEQDAQQTSQTNNVDNKLGDNKDTSTISAVNILLGASNGVRLGAFDDNFINASISGATLNNIDQCIDRANSKLENTNSMVNKVVMCLGTNDVSKCKDDSDQVNVLLTQAIAKVKSHFPDSLIGICGIFPRKGTGNNTNILNATTTSVNKFIRKLCMKDPTVEYIDTISDFFNQRAIVKSMFDKNDHSGMHIGPDGSKKIQEKIREFLKAPNDVFDLTNTDRKRNLSDITTTPSSVDRKTKHSKLGSATEY